MSENSWVEAITDVKPGTYRVVSAATGDVLTLAGDDIHVRPYTDKDTQTWNLTLSGDIDNPNGTFYLTNPNDNYKNVGTDVDEGDFNGRLVIATPVLYAWQLEHHHGDEKGYFRLQVTDIPSYATLEHNKLNVQIEKKKKSDHQLWRLLRIVG